MAIVVAFGTSWRSSSSRFGSNCAAKKLTPVTLPPGRLRLATRPSLTGIAAGREDNRNRRGRGLGRQRRRVVPDDHGHRPANQFGRQRRQPIGLIFRPAVFDRDVLALDEAGFLQALAERLTRCVASANDVLRRKPITGIACCARAASGSSAGAAAPPSSAMNARRLMVAA